MWSDHACFIYIPVKNVSKNFSFSMQLLSFLSLFFFSGTKKNASESLTFRTVCWLQRRYYQQMRDHPKRKIMILTWKRKENTLRTSLLIRRPHPRCVTVFRSCLQVFLTTFSDDSTPSSMLRFCEGDEKSVT